MSFDLVDSGWDAVLKDAIRTEFSCIQFICPFIKKSVVERLLANKNPKPFQIITRLSEVDFWM